MDMLDFLYHTIPGRMLLKPLTAPALSKLCGRFLDSSLSHFLVRPFIQTNNIRIEDYETDHIRSFNDFFSRKIREGLRRRGGYCPCRLEKTEDNKCICKEFREQMKDPNFEGYCHCMLYYKTKDPVKEEASHAEDHSDQL